MIRRRGGDDDQFRTRSCIGIRRAHPAVARRPAPRTDYMSSPSAIDALLRRYDSGEYFSRLINHPTPHRLRQAPELVYHATLNAVEPRFTIVMPTFNHESNVQDSLDAAVTRRVAAV